MPKLDLDRFRCRTKRVKAARRWIDRGAPRGRVTLRWAARRSATTRGHNKHNCDHKAEQARRQHDPNVHALKRAPACPRAASAPPVGRGPHNDPLCASQNDALAVSPYAGTVTFAMTHPRDTQRRTEGRRSTIAGFRLACGNKAARFSTNDLTERCAIDLRAAARPVLPGQRHFVGLGRLELPASSLSGMRSNQLSYSPLPSGASYQRARSRPRAAQRSLSSSTTVMTTPPMISAKRL